MSDPSDIDRRRTVWEHPFARRQSRLASAFFIAAVVPMLWGGVVLSLFGGTLDEPLPARPSGTRCHLDPDRCDALLPDEVRALPSAEDFENRLVQSLGAVMAMHPHPLPVSTPHQVPAVVDLAEKRSNTYDAVRARLVDLEHDEIQKRFVHEEFLWSTHRAHLAMARLAQAALALGGVLGLLCLVAVARRRQCRPVEVTLDRHAISLDGIAYPIDAQGQEVFEALAASLLDRGYELSEFDELLADISRIRSKKGEEPSKSAEEREALARLLSTVS